MHLFALSEVESGVANLGILGSGEFGIESFRLHNRSYLPLQQIIVSPFLLRFGWTVWLELVEVPILRVWVLSPTGLR